MTHSAWNMNVFQVFGIEWTHLELSISTNVSLKICTNDINSIWNECIH